MSPVPAAGIFLQMTMTSSLAVRGLLWTILLPGFFAGFLPWRYFGLRNVVIDGGNPRHLLGVAAIAIGVVLLGACFLEFARRAIRTLAPVDPPVLVVQGERDPFGIPPEAPGRTVTVLHGATHTIRGPAAHAAGVAVTTWLKAVLA